MRRAHFEVLYREHYHRIHGLCRRLLATAPDEAEDAAQEAFMRAYGSLHQYQPDQPFAAWINRIASNHCIDLLRKRQRWSDVIDPAGEAELRAAPDAPDDQSEPLISSWEAEAVVQALAALPERFRLPLVMAYYGEASYDEIAQSLGITANHVGVLLLRGRDRLRKDLAAAGLKSNDQQEH